MRGFDGTGTSFVLAAGRPFVITQTLAAILSIAILAIVLVVFHLTMTSLKGSAPAKADSTDPAALAASRRRGVKALIIGKDGRASTSKTQVILWTIAVAYALLFLLLWGRSVGCTTEGATEEICKTAAEARDALSDLRDAGLQPTYYVLLGFPLAAAIAARAITQTKVDGGTLVKAELPTDYEGGVASGLAEVVSNDSGESDLMDFQYFLFNLIALGFFFLEFVPDPGGGLPDLPAVLLSLTGLSTAAYTTKKALETTPETGSDDEPDGPDGNEPASRKAPGARKRSGARKP